MILNWRILPKGNMTFTLFQSLGSDGKNTIPTESDTEINCTEQWEIYQYMVFCFSIPHSLYTPWHTYTESVLSYEIDPGK